VPPDPAGCWCGKWFSRLAQPTLSAWSRQGKPLALEQKEPSKEDQEAKAVACYGAVEEGTGQILLRFSPGQPNSGDTLEFLKYLLWVAEEKGKQALLLIWDNASWHKSKGVREWVKGHNHQVKQEGGVRLLTYLLPIKSPWLNPQEPHWVHCKRNVVEPKAILREGQLKEPIRSYFNSDTPLESLYLSLVDLH
jgi:transposase